MKIRWFAHAAFLLEGDGLRLVTDPYTPEEVGYAPITEPADIVIRSSADDASHCNAAMIPGAPVVVTATEVDGETVAAGLRITAVPAQESLVHKLMPGDNAMYAFSLEGIRVVHMGDVGNRLTDDQLAALGQPDILLAPTGGPPTIELDDLADAIAALRPRLIIPMHYQLPGSRATMLPVTAFTERFAPEALNWHGAAEIDLSGASLPTEPMVLVLQPSTAG